MTIYKKIDLNHKAIEYIENTLAIKRNIEGTLVDRSTLAGLLLQKVNLSSGKTYTYLPTYVTEESIYLFDSGGKIKINEKEIIHLSLNDENNLKESGLGEGLVDAAKFVGQYHGIPSVRIEPVPNTDFWLTKVISEFLISDKNSICIFEDVMAKATDAWLAKRKSQIFTYNNEVYHFGKNASKKSINNTLKHAKTTYPPMVGILTNFNIGNITIKDSDEITLDILKIFVENIKGIIIEAYDGEGYVIWEKEYKN